MAPQTRTSPSPFLATLPVRMKDNIAISIPVAILIEVLKRELGEAQILLLLASSHAPDAQQSQILFDAWNKLLELEKTKNAEETRIKKIGDFDAIPEEYDRAGFWIASAKSRVSEPCPLLQLRPGWPSSVSHPCLYLPSRTHFLGPGGRASPTGCYGPARRLRLFSSVRPHAYRSPLDSSSTALNKSTILTPRV